MIKVTLYIWITVSCDIPAGRVKKLEKKMVQVIQEEDDDDMEEV